MMVFFCNASRFTTLGLDRMVDLPTLYIHMYIFETYLSPPAVIGLEPFDGTFF